MRVKGKLGLTPATPGRTLRSMTDSSPFCSGGGTVLACDKEDRDMDSRCRCLRLVATAAAAGLLAGCATTELVSQWKSPTFAGGPFKKVLLVSFAVHDTPRQISEDAFARRLSALGVDAVASYGPIPDRGALTQENIAKAASDAGADAILVCRLAAVDTRTGVSSGAGNSPPMAFAYDVFTLEVKLSDVKSSQPVWSAVTETADPGNIQGEIDRFAELIAQQLKTLGLI
jgi:hypothetical protein